MMVLCAGAQSLLVKLSKRHYKYIYTFFSKAFYSGRMKERPEALTFLMTSLPPPAEEFPLHTPPPLC